jgi:hypothetical protein
MALSADRMSLIRFKILSAASLIFYRFVLNSVSQPIGAGSSRQQRAQAVAAGKACSSVLHRVASVPPTRSSLRLPASQICAAVSSQLPASQIRAAVSSQPLRSLRIRLLILGIKVSLLKPPTTAVSAGEIGPCIDYLILALHWGDAPGLLQPQRNDMRSFRFHGILCRDGDNYIMFDPPAERERDGAKTILMLMTRNKSGRGHSHAHKLDLTENKKLCAFLKAYKPFACRLQVTNTPFLLCSRTGQPMSTSCLSSRCSTVAKQNLQP